MAKAAAKKVASQNAAAIKRLVLGTVVTSVLHVVLKTLWPCSKGARTKDWALFIFSALAEYGLGSILFRMGTAGDDLGQAGLTQVMWDSVYLVWFVHVATALLSTKFWIFLLVLPGYALYMGYYKVLVPFVLGGQDPIAGVFGALTGKRSTPSAAQAQQPQQPEEQLSKRQQKLQKRAERGDPRVRMQQQR